MRNILILIVLALVPVIQGCVLAAAGAAAAGGYALGEDRRNVSAITEDQLIERRAAARISDKHRETHINASAFNRVVLLTGEAPSAEVKASAEAIARSVENARSVVNEIQVGPNSAMSSRANDAFITSKVKGRFIDEKKFNSLNVNVITEAGTVYLMGLVRRQEANDATEIARTTTGVQRVVRVFEYLD